MYVPPVLCAPPASSGDQKFFASCSSILPLTIASFFSYLFISYILIACSTVSTLHTSTKALSIYRDFFKMLSKCHVLMHSRPTLESRGTLSSY